VSVASTKHFQSKANTSCIRKVLVSNTDTTYSWQVKNKICSLLMAVAIAGTHHAYPRKDGGGWVGLRGWLNTQIVYPRTATHVSNNSAQHYTTYNCHLNDVLFTNACSWFRSLTYQSINQTINQFVYFRHHGPYGKQTVNQWIKRKKEKQTKAHIKTT